MRLRWTAPAARDLYNITRHIRRDNPSAAPGVAKTIYDGCASLEEFPYRGRKGRIQGTRELVLAPLPYIVVYRIKERAAEIVRIYHGAQDWP
jgi:addiction module RelE/StbE family toxin